MNERIIYFFNEVVKNDNARALVHNLPSVARDNELYLMNRSFVYYMIPLYAF